MDLARVWLALKQADYRWAVPAVIVTVGSHLLRAWRWQMLLNVLPSSDRSKHTNVSLNTSFGSLMIGYMVNYAAPRLGEVARSANLSRREELSFSSVLGTVAVERVLDICILGGAMVSVFLILWDQIHTIYALFFAPSINYITGISSTWLVGGVGLAVLGVASLGYYWYRSGSTRDTLRQFWREHGAPLVDRFLVGLKTLFRSGRPGGIIGSTVGMWAGYLLMAYIPLIMLDMTEPFDLSLLDTWAIMILGTLGILVPVPGGAGSYHYITIQTMVYLFAVDEAAAATYAVLTHAGQMLLYVAVGMGFLVAQGSSLRTWRNQSAETPSVK